MGAREYEPDNGRFISADPFIDFTDPQQMNGYAYANNSPVSNSDPTGEMIFPGDGGGWVDSGGGSNKPAQHWDYIHTGPARSKGKTADDLRADAARQKADARESHAVAVARELAHIAADELGLTDALDCFTTGSLGACGSTAVNIATSFMGGVLGKLASKYGAPWKWAKLAALAKRVTGLIGTLISDWKAARRLDREAGRLEAIAARAKKAEPSCNSFVPGTKVLMADGSTEAIEDVDIGDKVVSTDPDTGKTSVRTVTAEIKGHGVKHLVRVTLTVQGKKSSVTATDGHPFWAPELHRWLKATDLHSGEWLRTSSGTHVQITAVRRWTATSETVHNLTVADVHTYYVLAGATPVLVHNCNGRDPVNGGLDDDTYDRIDSAHGPDVADGVDYQVQRMHDGSSTAADHDLPGIGHDPDGLASYFASWRGKMTHTDTRTGSRVACDSSRGVLIVTTGRNIHGFRYSQGAFESGRYVTP